MDQFFNDSTGSGEDGERDARGPWNEGGDWSIVEAPAFQEEQGRVDGGGRIDDRSTTTAGDPSMLRDLLLNELRDLLHAEGQVLKALPKMVNAAQSDVLRRAFVNHLAETEQHVSRLKESFSILGAPVKAEPCKGMAGLLAEGDEVIAKGQKQDDAVADLALIAAAQKVEHYEISGYGTSRALAQQIDQPDVALLLSRSLAEEEIADNLLTQIARELMSQSRAGVGKRQAPAVARKSAPTKAAKKK